MKALNELDEEIKFYLDKSDHQHLSDCLEMLNKVDKVRLNNYICELQVKHRQKLKGEREHIITTVVVEDVGLLVEGNPAKYSGECGAF